MPQRERERLARFVEGYANRLEEHQDALLNFAAALELSGSLGAEGVLRASLLLANKADRVRALVPPRFL